MRKFYDIVFIYSKKYSHKPMLSLYFGCFLSCFGLAKKAILSFGGKTALNDFYLFFKTYICEEYSFEFFAFQFDFKPMKNALM